MPVDFVPFKTPLNVAVLVDLERRREAGGHVKFWERIGVVAGQFAEVLDLTIFFQGAARVEVRAGNVRFVHLPPVHSTAGHRMLAGIPDHTDLARFHPALAAQLHGFDLIHTTDGCFAQARTAERFCRRTGTPLVHSLHTNTPALTRVQSARVLARLPGGAWWSRAFRLPDWFAWRMARRWRRHVRRCAAVLLSDGVRDSHEVAAGCGASWRRLRRGVDADRFHPSCRDRAWLEQRFGLGPEQFVLCHVGRLEPEKSVRTVALAARHLREAGWPVQVLFAGLGSEAGALRELLGEDVTFAGFLGEEELARAYASSDVLVFPSRIEIAPNVVLEAKASGLPVIVAKEGGGAMVRENGVDGIVLTSRAPDDWAEAIAGLCRDERRRQHFAHHGRREIEAHRPDWSQVLAEDLLPVWRVAQAASLRSSRMDSTVPSELQAANSRRLAACATRPAERILILIPHPDDEVVGCGIAALRARAAGCRLFGLQLTDGIPAAGSLWPWERNRWSERVARRLAEAGAVAARMGLELLEAPRLPARGLRHQLPATFARIEAALRDTGATQLWVPAYEGGHADHDCANFLASRFADKAEVWEFSEYHFAGGQGHRNEFITPRAGGRVIELTAAERMTKRELLLVYQSERENLRNCAGVRREVLRPLAPCDYARPPHEGTLWYERFHWVPFRHPRIDFTRGRSVCAAMSSMKLGVETGILSMHEDGGARGEVASREMD